MRIRQGAILRLRPIMVTALVAALGLLPAALATGVGTDSQRPFALVIVSGLFTRLLISVILMPALYTSWRVRKIGLKCESDFATSDEDRAWLRGQMIARHNCVKFPAYLLKASNILLVIQLMCPREIERRLGQTAFKQNSTLCFSVRRA